MRDYSHDESSKIRAAMEARVKELEAILVEQEKKVDDGRPKIKGMTLDFIEKCLNWNVKGDAEIFKKLFADFFVYINTMSAWLIWADHHWTMDVMDSVLASVEEVANVYDWAANQCTQKIKDLLEGDPSIRTWEGKRKGMRIRAHALRDMPRRHKLAEMLRTGPDPIAINGNQVDHRPYSLPCRNCEIDLRAGDGLDGRQSHYLLKASPTIFDRERNIDTPCPVWEKTVSSSLSGRQDVIDCFQRALGSALIGKVVSHHFFVLDGRGRNGKSVLLETVSKVLGPLAGPIRSEMLLDSYRSGGASGPTPEIMSLKGLRLAIASETDDGRRISPSKVKWLTGGDTLIGRNPHDKYETEFEPTHTVFLLTNNRPQAPAEDFAFWERMILFNFEISFVDREPQNENERRADPNLKEKLEQELPGILGWLVKGCLMFQDRGIDPPLAVRNAVAEYQRNEDIIADFVEDCCVVGEHWSVGATTVYSRYKDWWRENVSLKNIPSQKVFGSMFGKKFEKRKTPAVKYFGVDLID